MSVSTRAAGLGAFRWGFTTFVVVATSIPYLLCLLSTSAGSHYTWILPPYPEDSLAYRAWSEQAVHGSLLFRIKYTALPQSPFVFHPFFLACGWLSALLHCDLGVVFWAVKSAGVVLFFVVFFRCVDDLGLSRLVSGIATVLVGITSGFGGLLALLGPRSPVLSADLWVVDVNTDWSLLWNPMFPYALALMLLAVQRLERGTRESRPRDLWQSGCATGTLALIHPYSQPLLLGLALAIITVRKRARAPADLCRFAIPALPPALGVALVAKLHPLASQHGAKGVMTSPPLLAYLAGFGLPLLLVGAGLAVGHARLPDRLWPVAGWFLLSLTLAYLPVWFQRKLIFGAHVPLCILAGVSGEAIRLRLSRPWVQRWSLVAILLAVPFLVATPFYLLCTQLRDVRSNTDGAYFVADDLMKGLRFLQRNSRPDEVVFATVSTSRLVPGFSGNTVVWGHWAMSVDRNERNAWFADLFQRGTDWTDGARAREFWGTGIDYILADGRLKAWVERDPEAWRVILAEADRIYANPSVLIYRHRDRSPE
jgi:hypothetical protein